MKQSPNTLLRIKDVMRRTGLSKSYIYQLSELGKFPRQIQLVEGGKSVAWIEAEVQGWIEQRITNRINNR